MSARPSIGAMRHRLALEAPADVFDELGGFARGFTTLAWVWAHIAAEGAGEDFAGQRLEQSRRFTVTLRWRGDVTSQMRFDLRGRKLVIRSVEDRDERRRFLTCRCEEIS